MLSLLFKAYSLNPMECGIFRAYIDQIMRSLICFHRTRLVFVTEAIKFLNSVQLLRFFPPPRASSRSYCCFLSHSHYIVVLEDYHSVLLLHRTVENAIILYNKKNEQLLTVFVVISKLNSGLYNSVYSVCTYVDVKVFFSAVLDYKSTPMFGIEQHLLLTN